MLFPPMLKKNSGLPWNCVGKVYIRLRLIEIEHYLFKSLTLNAVIIEKLLIVNIIEPDFKLQVTVPSYGGGAINMAGEDNNNTVLKGHVKFM
jgi:hypothetical protein